MARGTVMLNATASPIDISSRCGDGPFRRFGGNNLFGGSTLDGFVLDQNADTFGGTALSLKLASAAQFGP